VTPATSVSYHIRQATLFATEAAVKKLRQFVEERSNDRAQGMLQTLETALKNMSVQEDPERFGELIRSLKGGIHFILTVDDCETTEMYNFAGGSFSSMKTILEYNPPSTLMI